MAALTLLAFLTAGAACGQAAGASNRVLGTVESVSGTTVAVKTDAGATVSVTVPDSARILQTAPGQKTLAGATKIAVTDIGAGDRVLMVVAGDPPAATIVVVNKKSDIDAMQAQEQADWTRRGVGGIVKSVDGAAGTLTITSGTRTITIHTTPTTVVRRYAPDSVKFSEAKPSTFAAIQPGDQVTARGDRSGEDVTAEEIVSGSFRNIAGVVESVDAGAGTLKVKDLVTKKTVIIKTTPDSDMRKLDPQMAQMIAMRLKGGQGGGNGAGRGASGGGMAAGGNGQMRQGGGAGGPGAQAGGAGALARLLQRSPEIHAGDLHKGDAVMIVATAGNPDEATAIRLVAGVEPMLQASTSGSQSMFSSAWSLGGGSSGGDQGGGEGSPQ
ncbi:MAG TPA: hypothetical protein VHZ09_18755 [Acidobacteriaceae bacterium]|jgi:hypothetical protein|nr:hypothetical protein [Acidobacteriaceae bacterium]